MSMIVILLINKMKTKINICAPLVIKIAKPAKIKINKIVLSVSIHIHSLIQTIFVKIVI